jgi:uncharacterized protein with HEPN domain
LPEPQGSRDWTLFLSDMQRFCARVIRYSDGMNAEQFAADELVTDAVLRNLELLGEAAKQIPDAIRGRHPDVPWRRIAGLRDVLAHAYFGLEDETIWQIVSSSVPALAAQLKAVALAEGTAVTGPSVEG